MKGKIELEEFSLNLQVSSLQKLQQFPPTEQKKAYCGLLLKTSHNAGFVYSGNK